MGVKFVVNGTVAMNEADIQQAMSGKTVTHVKMRKGGGQVWEVSIHFQSGERLSITGAALATFQGGVLPPPRRMPQILPKPNFEDLLDTDPTEKRPPSR